MLKLASLVATYFMTNMIFRDLVRKFAGPYLASMTQVLVRFVLKATVFIFVGAALLATGFILSLNEGARIFTENSYLYMSPVLGVNLAIFAIGVILLSIPAFTNLLVPKSMRANQSQPAPFLDMLTTLLQSITPDGERRQSTSGQPSTPSEAWPSNEDYKVRHESDTNRSRAEGTVH